MQFGEGRRMPLAILLDPLGKNFNADRAPVFWLCRHKPWSYPFVYRNLLIGDNCILADNRIGHRRFKGAP
jgi:hypothetical protein